MGPNRSAGPVHESQVAMWIVASHAAAPGDHPLHSPLRVMKARRVKELDLMADLLPLLVKRAGGREISGLSAYEQ